MERIYVMCAVSDAAFFHFVTTVHFLAFSSDETRHGKIFFEMTEIKCILRHISLSRRLHPRKSQIWSMWGDLSIDHATEVTTMLAKMIHRGRTDGLNWFLCLDMDIVRLNARTRQNRVHPYQGCFTFLYVGSLLRQV
jgi:hypothetical protein